MLVAGIVAVLFLLISSAARKAPRPQHNYDGSALQAPYQTIKLVVYQLQLADIDNAGNLAIGGIVTPLKLKDAVNSHVASPAGHRRLKIVKLAGDKIMAWGSRAWHPGFEMNIRGGAAFSVSSAT